MHVSWVTLLWHTPMVRDPRETGSVFAEAQHIQHVIFAGTTSLPPKRRLQCATGENRPVAGDVAQGDPLARGGEQNIMLPHDVTASDCVKANVPAFAFAGYPVAPPVRN